MSRTNKGQTPLHIAVEMAESQWLNREYNYGLTVKLLLGAGAAINTADSMANTPLHVRSVILVLGLGFGSNCWSNLGQTSNKQSMLTLRAVIESWCRPARSAPKRSSCCIKRTAPQCAASL
jgi:hypothetical protein